MSTSTRALACLGLCLLASRTAAAPAPHRNLSWQDCVQEVIEHNAELRAANAKLEAAQETLSGSWSTFMPEVSTSLDAIYGNANTTTTSVTATSLTSSTLTTSNDPDTTFRFTLGATQNLFAGFRDRAKVDQASADVHVAEAARQSTRAKVSHDLKVSYAGLLFAQQSVVLQRKIIARREQNLKLVELRFQSGRENRGSVLLSKAYLDQADFNALQATHQVETARSQLARVLGRDEDESFTIDDDFPLEPLVPNLHYASLAQETPEYRQAVAQEERADATVNLARSGYYPTLGVNGNVTRTDDSFFPGNQRWSIGATLTIPLFSGGRDYFGTRSAVASRKASSAELENTSRELLTRLREAYNNYQEASQKLKVDQSFLEAAFRRSEIARGKYNNGLMTFDDWDVIENDLIARETTVVQSRRELASAEAAWQQVRGQGVIQK